MAVIAGNTPPGLDRHKKAVEEVSYFLKVAVMVGLLGALFAILFFVFLPVAESWFAIKCEPNRFYADEPAPYEVAECSVCKDAGLTCVETYCKKGDTCVDHKTKCCVEHKDLINID